MAKDRSKAAAGDTVELKDKETGFFDPATGFKIVRGQTAKLGDTIGTKTNRALVSGALLLVESKAKRQNLGEGTESSTKPGGNKPKTPAKKPADK